jgi:hypothetical protein
MSKSKVQKARSIWWYVFAVGLTLLVPMLLAWQRPVSVGYVFLCFAFGAFWGRALSGNHKSLWGTSFLIYGWIWMKDIFFEREELHQYFWSITLQGGTTVLVAATGVAFLYERRRQYAQLTQSNNQLTS